MTLVPPIEVGLAAAIRKLWLEHQVLLFRDQSLDADALVAVSRVFGEPELPPAGERRARGDGGHATRPEIWIISNVVEDGLPIGSLGAGEAEWHSDMSYLEQPPSASVLYAVEVPARGGDTSFASQHAALDRLPTPLRAAVRSLRIQHDAGYTSVGEPRSGEIPEGAVHPALRIHPETRRPALFLGRRRNARVLGLPADESDRLLDTLWSHATRPELGYVHHWRPGDLLIWDNRSVVHRRAAFDPSARRILLRTQIA